MAAPAKSDRFSFEPAIPTASKPSAAALDALLTRFGGFRLPELLREWLLTHSGEQVQPSLLLAQNVSTARWKREALGPLYPLAGRPAGAGEDEEDSFASYSLDVVNSVFADQLTDDDDGLPAAAAAAASSKKSAPKRVIPFFAFSESPISGHFFVLDTTTQHILLMDPTHRAGPWICAESFDDMVSRLSETETELPVGELEEDEEETAGHMDSGDADEDAYACDRCMDEMSVSDERYHCNTCQNFDLCPACYAKNGSSKQKASDDHPASHTFTKIEARAEQDENEQEEKGQN